MRALSGAAALLLASAAHGAAAPDRAPIIGGLDPGGGWREVVGLTNAFGLPYCSGTLVAPRLVLTAAHCLDVTPAWAYFGTTPVEDGVFVPVEAAIAHPDHDAETHHADLGLVVLARPATLTPARRARALDDAPSAAASFVGFGYTEPRDAGEQGVKRSRDAAIDGSDAELLRYGAITCRGDSGGAVFVDDGEGPALAGVISHGDGRCEAGGAAIRVDVYAAWIDERIAELDPADCRLDLRCADGCAAPDPDCGGLR